MYIHSEHVLFFLFTILFPQPTNTGSIQQGRLKLNKVYCFRRLSPFQYSPLNTAENWQAAFQLFIFTSYGPTSCNKALFNVFWCMCYLINTSLLSSDHQCLAQQNILQMKNGQNNIISWSKQSVAVCSCNAVSLPMLVYNSMVRCWQIICINQHWYAH